MTDLGLQQFVLELHTRVTQLEKLVHYPNSVKKEENLYAPLRSDAGATLAMASLLRKMIGNDYSYRAALSWRAEAKEILEKYSK